MIYVCEVEGVFQWEMVWLLCEREHFYKGGVIWIQRQTAISLQLLEA